MAVVFGFGICSCAGGIAKKTSEPSKESIRIISYFSLFRRPFENDIYLIACPYWILLLFLQVDVLLFGTKFWWLKCWPLNFGSGALLLVGAKAVYPCPERFTPPGGPTVSPVIPEGKIAQAEYFFQAIFLRCLEVLEVFVDLLVSLLFFIYLSFICLFLFQIETTATTSNHAIFSISECCL